MLLHTRPCIYSRRTAYKLLSSTTSWCLLAAAMCLAFMLTCCWRRLHQGCRAAWAQHRLVTAGCRAVPAAESLPAAEDDGRL